MTPQECMAWWQAKDHGGEEVAICGTVVGADVDENTVTLFFGYGDTDLKAEIPQVAWPSCGGTPEQFLPRLQQGELRLQGAIDLEDSQPVVVIDDCHSDILSTGSRF